MAMVEIDERIRGGLAARVAACTVAVALAAGCGGGGSGKPSAQPVSKPPPAASTQTVDPGSATSTPNVPGGVVPVYPPGTKLPAYAGTELGTYISTMQSADSHGLKVWAESDLVKQWLAGPDAFNVTIQKLAAEAKAVPNLAGFKIADELGQSANSTTTPQQALEFLKAARAALNANAPGKLIMIDLIGYDLGCLPDQPSSTGRQTCLGNNTAKDSRLSLETIDAIVNSGYIDEMNVTTNMLSEDQYQKQFGVSQAAAQKSAFAEIARRGWAKKIFVNSRKALSWPTSPAVTTPDQAAAMAPNFIDVPLASGVQGVDIWSWSQKWTGSGPNAGSIVQLMSPGYTTNALWTALVQRHKQGDTLYVHYTPTYKTPGGSVDQDMAAMATAFSAVFVAAGTK